MFQFRPVLIGARLSLAVGASLTLAFGSLPGTAAAQGWSTTQPAHVDPLVQQKAAIAPSADVRVIITQVQGGVENEVRNRGGRVLQKLQLGNATVAEVPANQLDELAKAPGVVRIAYDAPVTLQSIDPLDTCCNQLQTVYPLAVDAVSQWTGARRLLGTGIGVAVLDSGVNANHPDFLTGGLLSSTRVLKVLNGISGTALSGDDDNGHGTFVAGIIAGRGWGVPGRVAPGSYIGIAPDANIISIKVSDSTGMAHVSDVIAAIEWVARHRHDYNIRVLNLSMATNVADSYLVDMLDAAVELAWLQGIVVVVAVGNGGPNAPITAPANDPFVITVGATDDRGTPSIADDVLASFSSYGRTIDGVTKPDLVAPGRNIVSTLSSPTAPLATQFPARVVGDGAYIRRSGTSAAAPVVSGVIAQLLQARPDLTPGQVKWLLTHTAQPVAGPGTGAGYPRVGAAVDYPSTPGNTNRHRLPNLYLLLAYASTRGVASNSVSWNNVSWNNVSWDNVSWDNVSWNNVSWNNVAWDNVAWNNVAWDNLAWLPAN